MLTPEDLWHRLVEEAGEDAIESAAGTSVAQAERDLAAAGFDVKAERARANERIAELTGVDAGRGAGDPATEPSTWVSGPAAPARRAPASGKIVWLAAALAAAAATGGILYALGHRAKPPDKPIEGPREVPTVSAPEPAPSPRPVAPSEPRNSLPEKPYGGPRVDPKAPPRQQRATP
jgi:hypothetical protein